MPDSASDICGDHTTWGASVAPATGAALPADAAAGGGAADDGDGVVGDDRGPEHAAATATRAPRGTRERMIADSTKRGGGVRLRPRATAARGRRHGTRLRT